MIFTDIFFQRQLLASIFSRLVLIVGQRAIAASVSSRLRWRHIMKFTDIFIHRQLLASIFSRLIRAVEQQAITVTVLHDRAGSKP